MITRNDILMGRDRIYPIDAELESNLARLLESVHKLEDLYGKPFSVSSGYRPYIYNTAAGGSAKSAHTVCEAVDLHDKDGAIKKWMTVEILEKCSLYMEDPHSTPSWCHVQVRPTIHRVFKP